ncbi:MAG: TlyA family RNA methyltransferase [Bdellovibrionales bacterium]|nr:TlyA family RNA methyltransferase [Bdellovibrionales bacterium]
MRLDQWLSELPAVRSRSHARDLILNLKILVNGKAAQKPSMEIREGDNVEILGSDLSLFVSRGGAKLNRAMEHLGVNAENLVCLDVGSSTGGFSDCLLRSGARFVVGIEVGTDQAHELLRKNSKFVVLEKTDIRKVNVQEILKLAGSDGFDFIVGDVSFISVTETFEVLSQLIRPNGRLLVLVKPQFEVERQQLNKKGIVKDPSVYASVKEKIQASLFEHGFDVIEYFDSELEGKDGNKEFFAFASPSGTHSELRNSENQTHGT